MERLKEVLMTRPWLKRHLRETSDELKIVVISTRDETGRTRRARLNFKAMIFDAKTPADVSERVR